VDYARETVTRKAVANGLRIVALAARQISLEPSGGTDLLDKTSSTPASVCEGEAFVKLLKAMKRLTTSEDFHFPTSSVGLE
jgi:hypothetical protein